MKIKSIAAALVSLTIFSIPVEVRAQINDASESMSYLLQQSRYELPNHYLSDSVEGYLSAGESELYHLDLTPGVEYTFMAACDSDCSDIDFAILYDDQEVIARTEVDDFPTQVFTPLAAGYSIQVKMHDCRTSVCGFTLGLFVE
jgi:hypothetical protein